MLGQVMTV